MAGPIPETHQTSNTGCECVSPEMLPQGPYQEREPLLQGREAPSSDTLCLYAQMCFWARPTDLWKRERLLKDATPGSKGDGQHQPLLGWQPCRQEELAGLGTTSVGLPPSTRTSMGRTRLQGPPWGRGSEFCWWSGEGISSCPWGVRCKARPRPSQTGAAPGDLGEDNPTACVTVIKRRGGYYPSK